MDRQTRKFLSPKFHRTITLPEVAGSAERVETVASRKPNVADTNQLAIDAKTPAYSAPTATGSVREQIADLTSRVQVYETLLLTLYPRLDPPSAQHVDKTLHMVRISKSLILSYIDNIQLSSQQTPCGPQAADRPVPLLRTLAFGEEDLSHNKIVQSIGIIGQLSGMAWLYRLKRHLHQDSSKSTRDQPDWLSISSVNYFLDDTEFSVSDNVDLSWWPPQPTADQLVHLYFQTVHPAFPIIGRPVFLDQYQRFYSSPKARPGNRWLSLLNLIFAIAARHSTMVNCQIPCGNNDESVYFSRAWLLSTGSAAPMDHPDLQQVQIEGLTAMYLLSVGHVSRSWRAIGNAIRSAITMGLNFPISTSRISQQSKETRYRLWWALFVLETDLCVMTGRPPSTNMIDCATPLPAPFQEDNLDNDSVAKLLVNPEARNTIINSILSNGWRVPLGADIAISMHLKQPKLSEKKQVEAIEQELAETPPPNTSLYFLFLVDLTFIMREAIATLYAPAAAQRSWHNMETAATALSEKADRFLSRLPSELQFTNICLSQPFIRQRFSLAFYFYSTKLIISHPCFCRMAYSPPNTGPLSPICSNLATQCVDVAGQMLNVLPDSLDIIHLYGFPPWWDVFHRVMQSKVVLLVHLCTHNQLDSDEIKKISETVNKAARWLKKMSSHDPSSSRSLHACKDLVSRHDPKLGLGLDLDD
ncbi:C6 transcription factor [Penicillium riverlandense]|uniref:C6 transcription factor n=1 Tax=Penicillium riverlandense TaxID=1903569 RepID=UPI002547E351|nr:C6 transcription factor [Penicillium riverlandense]KAJ5820621.1 C6 transcription factor [Penicillium riverlandense]